MGDDKIKELYRGASGREYQEKKRGIPPETFDWVARVRARKLAPYIQPGDAVFEYGVGTGWNLAKIECARKLGYDLADFLAEEVERRGIEFVRDPALIKEATIDVLLLHHVLEHVKDPADLLDQGMNWLRPGGTLLVFVPYEKESRYRRYNPAEPNRHLYSWNVQTMGNLVEAAGFKVLEAEVTKFSYDRFSAVWAHRTGTGEIGYRLLRELVHLVRPCLEVKVAGKKG